jgi:type IV secretory pathway VirB4 component
MHHPDSASFVFGIAKRARKYYLGLTTATQDVQDFLASDYGKAVLSNSSIQILLKQSPTEIDQVSQVFYLSQQEKELLLSAGVGEGLFFAGASHVAMRVMAASFEHNMITSNPEEILKMRQEESSPPQSQSEESQSQPEQNKNEEPFYKQQNSPYLNND